MSRIVIVGAGMMGSALAVPLVRRGHAVDLVGTHLDDDIVRALQAGSPHPGLRCTLPSTIRVHPRSALSTVMDEAEVIALGVSSAGVRWAADAIRPHVSRSRPILMITKGLDLHDGGLRTLPDLLASLLPPCPPPVAVAGPCIAGELARSVPTCVVFTGRDPDVAHRLAARCRGDFYHVFVEPDVVAAEVCAALKNAYAMGIALAAGMHEAAGGQSGSVALHNVESAVFAQSVFEMQSLIRALGGNPDVASGLAGVGDLDVTCNGGRTGRFGRLLGLGLGRDEAIRRMDGATLECLEILEVMRRAATSLRAAGRLDQALPLLEHLTEIALDDAPVALPLDRFFGATA